MNVQLELTQYQENNADACSLNNLTVAVGEVILDRAREIGHQIEDRVQRTVTQSEANEGEC